MYHRRRLRLFTIMSWFALVLCLGVTIDWVDDLAFEDTDIVEGLTQTSEEVENPDEHLLLRSVRADGSAVTLVTLAPSADSAMRSFSFQPVTASAWITPACRYPSSRSSPVSFITPLRI